MSGLVEYLYKILGPTLSGDLPCALGDGFFPQSEIITTTKVHAGVSRDEKRLMKRLTLIRQPVELQYGNFIKKRLTNCVLWVSFCSIAALVSMTVSSIHLLTYYLQLYRSICQINLLV